MPAIRTRPSLTAMRATLAIVLAVACTAPAPATSSLRTAFFAAYPAANGTRLSTLPSRTNHCGACHMDFSGGGTRNSYGARISQVLSNYPNTSTGRRDAILSIQNEDSDNDGYTNLNEISGGAAYSNAPTFPGLSSTNMGSVSHVSTSDIAAYLVPVPAADTTGPTVALTKPNGGESLLVGAMTTIEWTATDANGVTAVDLHVSYDNGANYTPVAAGLANNGTYAWLVPNHPTTQGWIRVTARDPSFNAGADTSNAAFAIRSARGDMNCDGFVNNFDIDPFVLAIIDTTAYDALYPGCNALNGDVLHDDALNNFDIDPFVNCILNLPPGALECP